MFGIFDTVTDTLESVGNSISNTVDSFVDDPIGTSVDIATQPIRDGAEIIQGLTEGEIRTAAALRLGTDVVAGMALSEIIEALSNE